LYSFFKQQQAIHAKAILESFFNAISFFRAQRDSTTLTLRDGSGFAFENIFTAGTTFFFVHSPDFAIGFYC
jgi:hypothetical protein